MQMLLRLALVLILAAGCYGATLTIDPFTTNQTVSIPQSGASPQSSGIAAPFAIGGSRYIEIARTVGNDAINVDVNVNTPGALSYSTDVGAGGPFRVLWDGGTDGTVTSTGLGGVDLSFSGMDRFRIAYQYDLTLTFLIRVYTDATHYSDGTFTFSGPNGFTGPYNVVDVMYSAFSTGAGAAGAANFASVGAIELSGTSATNPAADFKFDFIEVTGDVPEPATMAMAGAALLGLALIRRKIS